MFKLLWSFIKFGFMALFACFMILAVGAVIEFIAQHWLIILLTATFAIGVYFYVKYGRREKKLPEQELHTENLINNHNNLVVEEPSPVIETRQQPDITTSPIEEEAISTQGMHQVVEESSPLPAKPLHPDATDWNAEIPMEELTGLLAQRPFYDNYLMRCTPDGHGDLPERFSDLSRFVVLDIETTGLNPQRDRIIEVAAVRFENFQVTGAFATLVNPEIPLPRRITELTGITPAEVRVAPRWQEIQQELISFIGDYTLIGHNLAGFDIRFLNNAIGYNLPNPLIDTLEYSRTVFPDLPRHKLSYLKQVLNINTEKSHRALEDVKTTFFLLVACMRQESSMEPIYSSMDVLIAENANTYVPPIPPKRVKPSDIGPIAVNADPNNPLYGKRIVFTGELSIAREQAMRLAAERGALLRTAVSGKTDFLVVGQQDLAVVGADGISSKEKNAHLLNDLGKAHIQIIDETQFRELTGTVS